jgi:hypothetical protein
MKNKEGFMVSKMEDTEDNSFVVTCFLHKQEGNEEQLLAASPLILDAAEWAFNVLQDAEDYRLPVSQLLSDEGHAKWAEYVKAIRQVDPNEPLLPRERE